MPDEVSAASLEISTSPVTPDVVTQKKLERLYQRIDQALKDNRKAEILAMLLCTLLFVTGLGLFIAGYVLREPFYTGSGVVVEIGIIWPIKRIIALRDENVKLSVLPGMLDLLPPEEAAKVWREWYEKWFSQK